MSILFLILGIVIGIVLMKIYLFFKREKEISTAKANDLVITKGSKIGILINYHRNFDCPYIDDEIVYEIKDIYTGFVEIIGKSTIYYVISKQHRMTEQLISQKYRHQFSILAYFLFGSIMEVYDAICFIFCWNCFNVLWYI